MEMKSQIKRKALLVALDAARTAGRIMLTKAKSITISHKGRINDLVTNVDREAEKAVVAIISKRLPGDGIVAEEGTSKDGRSSGCLWHIDPIDGTTNYAHGFPFYCVSLGLEIDGVREVGVVYNPALAEIFWAIRGYGAFRNTERIKVSSTTTIAESLLATGFPYDVKSSKANNINFFDAFIRRARAIRRPGSAAIDLCYTACGIFDGFWELKLKSWDIAAGSLIAEEAGAVVTGFSGKGLDLNGGEIVAGNPRIHRRMLDIIGKTQREEGELGKRH